MSKKFQEDIKKILDEYEESIYGCSKSDRTIAEELHFDSDLSKIDEALHAEYMKRVEEIKKKKKEEHMPEEERRKLINESKTEYYRLRFEHMYDRIMQHKKESERLVKQLENKDDEWIRSQIRKYVDGEIYELWFDENEPRIEHRKYGPFGLYGFAIVRVYPDGTEKEIHRGYGL